MLIVKGSGETCNGFMQCVIKDLHSSPVGMRFPSIITAIRNFPAAPDAVMPQLCWNYDTTSAGFTSGVDNFCVIVIISACLMMPVSISKKCIAFICRQMIMWAHEPITIYKQIRYSHLKYVKCLAYIYTCKYVHTSHMSWLKHSENILLSLQLTKTTEKIKEIWWTSGVAVRETQRQELFPSSVLSKHFILSLLTACGNRLLLFVMQWEASLENPRHSHTRGSSFISRPLLLSLTWQSVVSNVYLAQRRLTRLDTLLLAWGRQQIQIGKREEKNTHIVTDAKTLWRDPRRTQTRDV